MRLAAFFALVFALAIATHAPLCAQNATVLPAQDRALAVQYERLFSIGAADGRDWEILNGVTRVAFDKDGRLYVLDTGNARVLLFDASGRFIRQIGRRGSGPGEFQAAAGLTVLADGTLVVGDAAAGLVLFDARGEYLRSVQLGEIRVLYPSIQADGSGGVVMHETATSRVTPRITELYRHTLRAGTSAAVRLELPRGDTTIGQTGQTASGFSRVLPAVFSPTVRFAVWGPGRIAVATDDKYEIRVDGNGGVTRLSRAIAPRAVTERDREAVREARRARAARSTSTAAVQGFAVRNPTGAELEAELRALRFAETVPVIAGIGADAAGRLWIARVGPVAPGDGPIDIVAPVGRYRGTLPATSLPAAFGPNDRIARIVVDDEGVERVVVARVVGLR